MKTGLFAAIAFVVMCFIPGAYFGIQAHSNPTSSFISLQELVPLDEISTRCEGQVVAVKEKILDQEGIGRSVTNDEAHLRQVFAPSLVGQPSKGYAAYANLISPNRVFEYSLWIYNEPSEATTARLQWQKHFQSLARGSSHVTEEPNAFAVEVEQEFGLPLWGRVVQKGTRLLVIKVKALPPSLTLEDIQKEAAHLRIAPEDGETTKAFFETVSRSIEQSFLEDKE